MHVVTVMGKVTDSFQTIGVKTFLKQQVRLDLYPVLKYWPDYNKRVRVSKYTTGKKANAVIWPSPNLGMLIQKSNAKFK